MVDDPSRRILSIDLFRGLTILLMVFANSVSKIGGLPWWMDHSFNSPDKKALITWMDVIFPAFLFIMGLSIPLAMTRRLEKKQSLLRIGWHILYRSLALLWIGAVVHVYAYRADLTKISTAVWYFMGFVASVGLWATWPLTGSDKKGKVVVGWAIRLAAIAYFVWASYALRAGNDGCRFFAAGGSTASPAFPMSILGHLGFAYLLVAPLWLALRRWPAACLGVYGLLVCVSIHLGQHGAFLVEWLGPVGSYLKLPARLRCVSMVLAGTIVGALLLPGRLRPSRTGRPGLPILGFAAVLLAVATLVGGDFLVSFLGLRRTLFMTGLSVLAFWVVMQIERLFSGKKATAIVTKPVLALGRNPLLAYMLQFGLAGLVVVIVRNPKIIDVVPGYIMMAPWGWWSVLAMSIPYTAAVTALVMLANRFRVISRL